MLQKVSQSPLYGFSLLAPHHEAQQVQPLIEAKVLLSVVVDHNQL